MASLSQAGLVKSDFQTVGDGYLVTDTVTTLQWLSPVATRNQTYGNATVQNIVNTYGFRYATYSEATGMLISNFGPVTTVALGDAAGFAAASNFFNIFGVTENVSCGDNTPCPRTQGLTSDAGAFANTHLATGMITFGSTGWMITDNSWPDSFAEAQMGSWLVRGNAAPTQTPEPASIGLVLTGAVMMFIRRRNRSA